MRPFARTCVRWLAAAVAPLAVVAAPTRSAGQASKYLSYRVAGTFDDGGSFDGTLSYWTFTEDNLNFCEGEVWGSQCQWNLDRWNVAVTGGLYSGDVVFSGTAADYAFGNFYGQIGIRSGTQLQRVSFADVVGNMLTVDFDGSALPNLGVGANPFVTGATFYGGQFSYAGPAVFVAARGAAQPGGDVSVTDVVPPVLVTDASISAVPEPTTALLAAGGLVLLASLARRRSPTSPAPPPGSRPTSRVA